jgi:DNA-binding transcriptional LysR family regulator
MELRQLTYFAAVAEERHFGRAAARIGITQPSLTQQIQRLEKELDVTLLDRNSHAVGLTQAGQLFLREARATIRLVEDATAMVRPRVSGRRQVFPAGTVRVGYVQPAAARVLPEALRRLLQAQPRARVKLAALWTAEQIQGLLSGELDVGFVFGPVSHPELRATVLGRESFAVLVPAAHPLAGSPRIDFADLAGEPLVWFRRELSPAIYDQFSWAAAVAGAPLNICHEAEHQRVMRLLVAAGQAVGVITMTCAKTLRDPGVAPRQLGAGLTEELAMVWRADEDNPLVAAFVDAVRVPAGPASRAVA